jgi:hypothetical protein
MNWYAKNINNQRFDKNNIGTLKSGFFVNKNKNFLPLPLKQPKTLGERKRLISFVLVSFIFLNSLKCD